MRLIGLLALAAATVAASGTARADEAACAAIEDMKLEGVNLLSSTVVEATAPTPAYCRVLGYARPAINFEVRMPVEGWNGKFHMAGCGGFCGSLASDAGGFINAINYALERGYAVATTDGGHWGESSRDARWAAANPVAEADWAWRAVAETTRAARRRRRS